MPSNTAPTVRCQVVAGTGPLLAVHGGAGSGPVDAGGELEAAVVRGMVEAMATGWSVYDGGGSGMDMAVAAVATMEDAGAFNAGRGAVPTTIGTVETDAAVMGSVRDAAGAWVVRAGAAAAMTWPANPVVVAREVARRGDALLLAGPGADRLAIESGLTRRAESTLTHGGAAPVSDTGTVGAVALDSDGHLGAATSTGGRRGQPPGRVGDSPVIGAGTWATDGGVAVSATGDGEAFILAGFAHRIDQAWAGGADLETAARAALAATHRWGGSGGAVVLAATGELVVLHDTASMAQGWRRGDDVMVAVDRRI